MNDLFDQQITDGLHRAVDGVAVPRGSFGDVRRRVRARRSRHVAAAVLPTLAGMAWIGTRSAGEPSPLAAGAATDSTAGSSDSTLDTAPDTAVTSSTEPTTTSINGHTPETEVTSSTEPTETTVIGDPTIALADQVARSAAVFEALGFPAGEIVAQGDDKVQLRALDPSRPDQHFVTLTIGRQGVAADVATVTTYSTSTRDGVTVVTRQNDAGWLYALEVTDYTPVATVPTGDQLIQLLISSFG